MGIKMSWMERITNEEVLARVREKIVLFWSIIFFSLL